MPDPLLSFFLVMFEKQTKNESLFICKYLLNIFYISIMKYKKNKEKPIFHLILTQKQKY